MLGSNQTGPEGTMVALVCEGFLGRTRRRNRRRSGASVRSFNWTRIVNFPASSLRCSELFHQKSMWFVLRVPGSDARCVRVLVLIDQMFDGDLIKVRAWKFVRDLGEETSLHIVHLFQFLRQQAPIPLPVIEEDRKDSQDEDHEKKRRFWSSSSSVKIISASSRLICRAACRLCNGSRAPESAPVVFASRLSW